MLQTIGATLEKFLATIDLTLGDVSFWIGVVVVFMFARERFGRRQADMADEPDLPVPIRSFTTRFRYNFAAFAYGGVWSTIYLALICIGAYPGLQDVIKTWFGAVGSGIDDKFSIATPLGAAVVVISLLPSLPFVHDWDSTLRATLRDFASIPLKACHMADLLIERLAQEIRATGDQAAPSAAGEIKMKLGLYDLLKEKIHDLQHLPRLRAARSYGAFFSTYLAFSEQIEDSMDAIRKEVTENPGNSEFLKQQIDAIIDRLAQFVICAILVVEADEYSALRTLSRDLRVPGISGTTWRFKSSQILLGIIVVFSAAVLGSVLAALAMRFLSVETPTGILEIFIPICAVLSIALVPIFVVPLIFAAGAQMYIIDRTNFRDELEWDEKVVAIAQTFVGCLGSALLITMILGVLVTRFYARTFEVIPILPWAIPSAVVALTFFLTSRERATWSRAANLPLDFLLHAGVAVVAALVAQKLSIWAGLRYQGLPVVDLLIYAITEPIPIALVAALIGGSLGAFQCAISREVREVPVTA